ncbi:reverse transcriptase domain-containing protein [Tanacetum coccineum]
MSLSTHLIIVLSDSDVEDAFSSTITPDYISASLDYFPASPGNTSSNSTDDLSKDLLASLTISPFHDNSYMKVFETGESSQKTRLERHEEQIDAILNHLDELPLERIEYMEDKREGLGNGRVIIQQDFDQLETELQEARTQIDGFQRKQMGHDDEIVLARVRISTRSLSSRTTRKDHQTTRLDPCHLQLLFRIQPRDVTMALLPPGFLEPLYPDMINSQDIKHMIPLTPPRDIEPPVGSPISLSPSSSNGSQEDINIYSTTQTQAAIKKLVADSVSAALEAQAATMANTDNTNRNTGPRETPVARKCSYKEFMSCQPFNFKGTEGAVGLIPGFERTESLFSRSNCTKDCKVKFATGTLTEEALSWWNSFAQPIGIEEAYKIPWSEFKKLLIKKEKVHYKSQCSRANNNAHGKAYLLRDKNAHQDPNVVTGMFLFNQHLARVLFDSGGDKSFISISLASMLNILPITLDTTYDIEMDDGNLVGTNTVIQGCTLILLNQPFKIDLMPIKLGSFDVVIGMDWLSKYHARIICDEKVIHIRIDGETLIIQGDRSKT